MKKNLRQLIDTVISDDKRRIRMQLVVLTVILFIISFGMFVLNSLQHVTNLQIVTGIFAVVCAASFLLLFKYRKQQLVTWILVVATTVMLLSFIWDGGIEGFSPIWMCLLPFVAMFFLGIKHGTVLSLCMLGVLLLCFQTPLHGLLDYQYSKTFMTRFPIVYISSFILALALEYIRMATYNKMRATMDLLDKLGKTDELTQIQNRRYFDQKLDELWKIISRANGQISMLMIDVDFFKNYNDHYGHMAGDKVLTEIADAITSAVNRKTDIAARWGGEEFAVLLPLTGRQGAMQIAGYIRQLICAKSIPHEFTDLAEKQITVSIGVATLFPLKDNAPDDLLKLADESLYLAKTSGRNRVGEALGQSDE